MLSSSFDESLCTSPHRPSKQRTLQVENTVEFSAQFDKVKSNAGKHCFWTTGSLTAELTASFQLFMALFKHLWLSIVRATPSPDHLRVFEDN